MVAEGVDFDDRLGVSACIRAYVACWNQHEIRSMIRCFSIDAVAVDSFGITYAGRQRIADDYLGKHRDRLRGFVLSQDSITVQRLDRDRVQAHCMWTVRHQTQSDRDDAGVYRFELIRQGSGRWLISWVTVIK